MNESTIQVTGTGSIHVVPDVTRLTVSIKRHFASYKLSFESAKENSAWFVKILEYNHQPGQLAKTVWFDISDHQTPQYDEDGNYLGSVADGYDLNQRVQIDFGIDNVLVNNVVRGIGKFIVGAQINIGYTVRDPRPIQLKMLERAVKDAKEKATIMATAAGRELGNVTNIEYGELHDSLSVYSQARNIHDNAEASASTASSLDITPEDLVMSDKVNVSWSLK
ncbi:MAG: SIMPL domain-containing protein [Bacteroidales bacterium]|nr:SIMPL domain-containing protein [Bacteroidales bacterium]